jgi:hypothetical protein
VSSRCNADRLVSSRCIGTSLDMVTWSPEKDAIQITHHAMPVASCSGGSERRPNQIESSVPSALFIIYLLLRRPLGNPGHLVERKSGIIAPPRRRPWTPSPRHYSARCLTRRLPDSSTRRTVISSAWPSSWAWSSCVGATLRRTYLQSGSRRMCLCVGR